MAKRVRKFRHRALVCGGRDFNDRERVKQALDKFHREYGIAVVIHGAARGADSLAADWALGNHIPTEAYPAQWDKYGKRAGYLRNQQMLDKGKPHVVIAFPGGRGTDMMCKIAEDVGVTVYRIPERAE